MNHSEQLAFTFRAPEIVRAIITPAAVSVPESIPDLDHKPVTVNALWDTGATNSVITSALAKKLNIRPTGRIQTHGVNETKEVNTYIVNILLPNRVVIQNVIVSEAQQTTGNFDVLIGMDIICIGDFAITNFNKSTTFSFRFPSSREIDFVPDADAHNRNIQRKKDRRKQKSQRKKKPKKR
jgi:hypothetical protein